MEKKGEAGAFVVTLDASLHKKLLKGLVDQGFEISYPQYTCFQGKKKGISCTLYESGKLMVQGKDKAEFIEFFLEPEILQSLSYSYPAANAVPIDTTGRIGIDESGKGDFFGPLCIAGVFASGNDITLLRELGVKDSKLLNDAAILKVAQQIRQHYAHQVVMISPKKYNEIYPKFGNLNTLLGWGHATAIQALVEKTSCLNVIIDQFAAESVVITALKRKKMNVALHQRHRAEEDLVVAAASILAREAFIRGLGRLGKDVGMALPKGASKAVVETGRKLVAMFGLEVLQKVAKVHFKTYVQVVS